MTDKRSETSAINGRLGGRPKELEGFEALPNENWRVIKGASKYFVSDHGRIISIKRGKILILKLIDNSVGYFRVRIYENEISRAVLVHRLVLEAFKGMCPEGMDGSHKDGNSMNNHIDNLEWETPKQNMSRKNGHNRLPMGEQIHTAKLKEADVIEIRQLLSEGSRTQKDIAKQFNVSSTVICLIKSNKIWKCVKV